MDGMGTVPVFFLTGPKFSRMKILRDFNVGLTILRILQHPSN